MMNICFKSLLYVHANKIGRRYYAIRMGNTLSNEVLEKHRKQELAHDREIVDGEKTQKVKVPRNYYDIYPEFLPTTNWKHRDRISEILERKDMLRRRSVIDIPEFYVGSILAVTVSDKHAPGKKNRFLGICILKDGVGLRAKFILRNIVDNMGVEIMYELYSPVILSIEVIKLEKRLDDHLLYLRDTDPKHSYVPFDMDKVIHPPGAEVPVNTTKVQLCPLPWFARWELFDLKGIEDPRPFIPRGLWKRSLKSFKPWDKYDLMKQYRDNINEEEADEVMSKVSAKLSDIEEEHRKNRLVLDNE